MGLPITGQVFVRRLPRSRGIRSFIEKRIQGWLYREGLWRDELHSQSVRSDLSGRTSFRNDSVSGGALPSFHVMFEREGEGHLVSCWIEVRLGRQVWRSARVGSGIQQAFIQSLQHLIPIHPPQPTPARLRLASAS